MSGFILCFGMLCLLSIAFGLIGIGPMLWCHSSRANFSLKSGILLSPLVGYVLVCAVGMLKLMCLSRLQPMSTFAILLACSLVLCWIYRRHLGDAVAKHCYRLIAPAVFFMLCFSFLFHRSGLELLSGAEDELQYCANAAHMLFFQNTGGPNDIPVPRVDHWLNDWQARFLCYDTGYRRGAEILLASVMELTSLPAPLAFPVLCGFLVSTLIVSLGTVASDCLRLDLRRTAILQFGCGLLFYLTLLHLQGCLANLCSIPCFLTGLALLGMAISGEGNFRVSALCGVFVGGAILFYAEVTSFEILFPMFAVLLERVVRSRASMSFGVLKRFAITCAIAALISTQGAMAIIPNLVSNLHSISTGIEERSSQNIVDEILNSPLPVQVGLRSFCAEGADECAISTLLSRSPELLLLYCGLLYSLGLYGFFGLGRRCRGLQLPFITLLLMMIPLLFSHEMLRVGRAFGYSIPYLLIGLVLSTRTPARIKLMPALGGILLALFLVLNAYSNIRALSHITSHTAHTEKLMQRLNPNAPDWCALREELNMYPTAPVLISEFDNTTKPHWIVSGIEPHPNVIGESITRFWKIYVLLSDTAKFRCYYKNHSKPLEYYSTWNWDTEYSRMIDESKLALVPPGGHYPREWVCWQDVLPAYRRRYTNMCDVVYKLRSAFVLKEGNALGVLEKDKNGIFRVLSKPWKPCLSDDRFAIYILRVTFEGDESSLTLRGLDTSKPTTSKLSDGRRVTEVAVASCDFGKLELVPLNGKVKLRGIELTEVKVER